MGRVLLFPAGELAVIEGEKEAAAIVPSCVVVAFVSEGAAAKLDDANKYAKQVAQRTKRLEKTVRQCCDIGCESDAEKIERIELTLGVCEANEVDGARATGDGSVERSLSAVFGEVAEKGIAGTEGEETERDALDVAPSDENAIEDLVGGAVAADGEETTIALVVGFM